MTPSQKRWSDEEKANIVDRATEIGLTAAAEEAGTSPQSICNWRNAGFGSAA